eukprot:scaffold1685_cov91-Cylindrotheca_fusiformis.AAC.3
MRNRNWARAKRTGEVAIISSGGESALPTCEPLQKIVLWRSNPALMISFVAYSYYVSRVPSSNYRIQDLIKHCRS